MAFIPTFTNSLIEVSEEDLLITPTVRISPTDSPTDDSLITKVFSDAVMLEDAPESCERQILEKILKRSPDLCQQHSYQELHTAVTKAYGLLQKAQTGTQFPNTFDTDFFRVVVASPTLGYMTTTVGSAANGSFKSFYKLLEIHNGPKFEIHSRAGIFINDVKKFKAQELKIDPFGDLKIAHVIAKSSFLWETNDFIFMVKPLFSGDIYNLAQEEKWDLKKRILALRSGFIGIKNIHENGFVHRDIKPQNIYCKHSKKNGEVIVVGDEDTVWEIAKLSESKKWVGTFGFFDPRRATPSPGNDIYAFGHSLFLLCRDLIPGLLDYVLGSRDASELSEVEQKIIDLIQKIKDKNADQRPSAAAVEKALLEICKLLGN